MCGQVNIIEAYTVIMNLILDVNQTGKDPLYELYRKRWTYVINDA